MCMATEKIISTYGIFICTHAIALALSLSVSMLCVQHYLNAMYEREEGKRIGVNKNLYIIILCERGFVH